MNALLQHRGHILMGAGHSIAVQNFNENLSILIMTTTYFAADQGQPVDLLDHRPVRPAVVAGTMWLVNCARSADRARGQGPPPQGRPRGGSAQGAW
jgi:LPLT family lysophospholipid transporter-like MFS transporter